MVERQRGKLLASAIEKLTAAQGRNVVIEYRWVPIATTTNTSSTRSMTSSAPSPPSGEMHEIFLDEVHLASLATATCWVSSRLQGAPTLLQKELIIRVR
jgi:hypothetical protein